MNALLTDLYQLTMAAGYYTAGKHREIATFELFVRRLPYNRNYYLAAGLAQAVDYLVHLRFTAVLPRRARLLRLSGQPALHRRPVRHARRHPRFSE
jgi:nicotinic acid phosphoribosyltransferase